MIGRFAHFQLMAPLGAGGMGVVYEARDLRLGRRVALKLVASDRDDRRDEERRLIREGETMALLNHPHICAVYEVGVHDGCIYIAMERLHGMNLKQRIAQRPLRTAEIVDVALQATSALSAAHGAGIVHRDIKPENIVVARSGRIKVLDFGLARRVPMVEARSAADGSTIPGRPIGTLNYMAPERILQMALDPRCDLFSLGVVMYEMATERLPFAAESDEQTLLNVIAGRPVPMRRLAPHRPAAFERIVHTLLATRPERRYASADALRDALLALDCRTKPIRTVTRKPGSVVLRRMTHE
jgi:serine/threonine-protein kinase